MADVIKVSCSKKDKSDQRDGTGVVLNLGEVAQLIGSSVNVLIPLLAEKKANGVWAYIENERLIKIEDKEHAKLLNISFDPEKYLFIEMAGLNEVICELEKKGLCTNMLKRSSGTSPRRPELGF